MSCNYAEGLSPYPDKGQLGMPERFAGKEEVSQKVAELAALMKASRHTVFHTGAGISTSAGIPDFRGPKGVWTLEKKGLKPDVNVSFDDARPTFTHMALVALEKAGLIQYLVTQNIDGLHLRSGFPRRKMAELHGNMYLDKCSVCKREFVRHTAVSTVGQKTTGVGCIGKRDTGRRCRGRLHDNILDWEHDLPHLDYNLAEKHSTASDLSVCLGTTLQIIPSGVLPTIAKQSGGKLVICNLQPTKHDKISDLIINGYVDDVMRELLSLLNVRCSEYSLEQDPVLITCALRAELKDAADPIEWTIPDEWFDDHDLIEKVHRNKQIASANNTNKRTPRPGKVDRRKRRSLIKEEPPLAAAGPAQVVKGEVRQPPKSARNVKEISDRNRRYSRGRKRQSDDVESAGEQPGDEKVKLQRLDDCKDDKVEFGKGEEMEVEDSDSDKNANAPQSNEGGKELKSESDSNHAAPGHVLLENISKDASLIASTQLDCSSRIKDETQVTAKTEDSPTTTSLLQPDEECSRNGPASSSVTGTKVVESSTNSSSNDLNATDNMATTIKDVTRTKKSRPYACDDASEEGRPTISQDTKDKLSSSSSIDSSNVTSSSVLQFTSQHASNSEPFVQDSNGASSKLNEKTVIGSNSPGEPTLKKQKLCQSENNLSMAESTAVNTSTSGASKVLVPHNVIDMKDDVSLQQAESDNKLLDGSPTSTNQVASGVCSPNKNETKETHSLTMLKSFMDHQEVSGSGKSMQKSSDSTGNAITKENVSADKSTDYSFKKTSDVSSVIANETDVISKTTSIDRLTATQQTTASEKHAATGVGNTFKGHEDGVFSETKGSFTDATKTSEDTKRKENNSATSRDVSKHDISKDTMPGDNCMTSAVLIGENVDRPKAEIPIQDSRVYGEAKSMGSNKCMTQGATIKESCEPSGAEGIKGGLLSTGEMGKPNVVEVSKEEPKCVPGNVKGPDTDEIVNKGSSKTAEDQGTAAKASIESVLNEDKIPKITETSEKNIAKIDAINKETPKALDKYVPTHTTN